MLTARRYRREVSDSAFCQSTLVHVLLLTVDAEDLKFYAFAHVQGAAEKSGPLLSLFSQQPFGILIRNFTALFTETFYI